MYSTTNMRLYLSFIITKRIRLTLHTKYARALMNETFMSTYRARNTAKLIENTWVLFGDAGFFHRIFKLFVFWDIYLT